jgi:hypothetical protein
MRADFTFSFSRTITALLLVLLSQLTQPLLAQCSNAPTLKFHSPVLLSGTNGQVGAMYNFAQVAPGIDVHVQITGIFGGATLYNIDDSTGAGYYDAFQPYVGAAANDTSYIDWRFTFKKAGTNIDTILPCLAVTGVDIDGDGSRLKEFIEAATPGSFSVDPNTTLTVSFDGVRSKAISPVANVPLIDTSHREAMFQMNFTNITTLDYRNGAISTSGSQQIRQTSIYFKPFFATYFLLPTTLLSFTAQSLERTVEIKWSATDEGSLKYYTLQRSENGRSWINIGNIPLLSSRTINNYLVNDFRPATGTTYYRLMEVSVNGSSTFSSIVKIEPNNKAGVSFNHNTLFNNNIRLQNIATGNEEYNMAVYSMSGTLVSYQTNTVHAGSNTTVIDMQPSAAAGVYLLVIKNSKGQEVYHSKLIKTN